MNKLRYVWFWLLDIGREGFAPYDGHFYVRYPDDERSIRMRHKTAVSTRS